MLINEFYDRIGGGYDSIKRRLCNDDIIKKFLLKFPNDPSYDSLLAAVDCGDIKEAFVATHTLKGVAANLSFDKMHRELELLTEQLRPLTENADLELLGRVKACYEEIIHTINEL